MQALQRKHEGLERDLAALGDKINQLDEKASKLMHLHTESSEVRYFVNIIAATPREASIGT